MLLGVGILSAEFYVGILTYDFLFRVLTRYFLEIPYQILRKIFVKLLTSLSGLLRRVIAEFLHYLLVLGMTAKNIYGFQYQPFSGGRGMFVGLQRGSQLQKG